MTGGKSVGREIKSAQEHESQPLESLEARADTPMLNEPTGPTVLRLIRGIQSGDVSPDTLGIQSRRACVEHLMAEGYTAVEIAEVLQICERTVARDRKAVRDINAVQCDPKMVERMVGRLLAEADLSIGRIRRTARDKHTPPASRIEGERECWQITRGLVQALQSLGYLPTAAQQVQADVTHRVGQPPDAQSVQLEIQRVSSLHHECGPGNDELLEKLSRLHRDVQLIEVGGKVRQIAESLENGHDPSEERNDDHSG